MVSTPRDSVMRLAGVLPSLMRAIDPEMSASLPHASKGRRFPKIDAGVLVVVDGLGWSNLRAKNVYARSLAAMPSERLETVFPSTTGAALSTLLTGVEPGEHGLLGYQIFDESRGRLRSTLSDWEDIDDIDSWQRRRPLTQVAAEAGLHPIAIGRTAHANSGLTSALLNGAKYLGANTIAGRFEIARKQLEQGITRLVYLYVDELDRAGHVYGVNSAQWERTLEALDSEMRMFTSSLPKGVGGLLTADHGMLDIPATRHVMLDFSSDSLDGIAAIGGEPRVRYLYLRDPQDALGIASRFRSAIGNVADVFTREEALQAGIFGEVDPEIRGRLGDVILIAKGSAALYTSRAADAKSRQMVGQHGARSADEMGVPLIKFGALA